MPKTPAWCGAGCVNTLYCKFDRLYALCVFVVVARLSAASFAIATRASAALAAAAHAALGALDTTFSPLQKGNSV